MNLTTKQMAILKVVIAGNGLVDDKFVAADLDQIIERLEYRTTKQSIQFSIRALIRHGLIEKVGSENRRNRRRVVIAPTTLGRRLYLTAPEPVAETTGDLMDLALPVEELVDSGEP